MLHQFLLASWLPTLVYDNIQSQSRFLIDDPRTLLSRDLLTFEPNISETVIEEISYQCNCCFCCRRWWSYLVPWYWRAPEAIKIVPHFLWVDWLRRKSPKLCGRVVNERDSRVACDLVTKFEGQILLRFATSGPRETTQGVHCVWNWWTEWRLAWNYDGLLSVPFCFFVRSLPLDGVAPNLRLEIRNY